MLNQSLTCDDDRTDHMLPTGRAEATVNHDIAVLKHLLNHAVDCGLIKSNPIDRFRKLKKEETERLRFTDKQIDKVIKAVRPDARPIFVFIRETLCSIFSGAFLQENSQGPGRPEEEGGNKTETFC